MHAINALPRLRVERFLFFVGISVHDRKRASMDERRAFAPGEAFFVFFPFLFWSKCDTLHDEIFVLFHIKSYQNKRCAKEAYYA